MKGPVIFLAFANDHDDYLPSIKRERKNIKRALNRHHDEGLIRVEAEPNTTLEDIFEAFNRFNDEVAIFHYGGHAGGTHLQLETAGTQSQKAFAGGLAQMLGQQKKLQLVFLNGCATKGQVDLLLKSGVKAVIATSVPIQDRMATEFAEQFYNSLASHTPLQRAFMNAKAFVATKYEKFEKVRIYRDVVLRDFEETEKIPWGLYWSQGGEKSLQWTLPRAVTQKRVVKNRFDYETRVDVNDILIGNICEKLAYYNKDLDYELSKDELDIPAIKREIVDSFPTPIGEQLRKLFTRSNDPDRPDEMEHFTKGRLRQLDITHRTTVKFLCFILLSQLWDEKHRKKNLQITEDYIVDFNSFFALGPSNFESFDFVKFLNTITDFFDANSIPYFMEELKGVQIDSKKETALYDAYIFMNSLHESLNDDIITDDQVEPLCMEAEDHLASVLNAVAFLVDYKLVTIKNIEIIKNRHEIARFRHNQITLNRALTVASTGIAEVGVEFYNYTDNKSVLFLKTRDNKVSEYLNLSPFIIDENALNSDYSTKLFLFSFENGGEYNYQFLNNLRDEPLIINQENHPSVKFQFDRFRSEIFGKDYEKPLSGSPPSTDTGSRFFKKR